VLVAVHLGMDEDIPFMERPAWLDAEGKPKYKIFCPVTLSERVKRLSSVERRAATVTVRSAEVKPDKSELRSALELQFDWALHQMVGYMRRLDGEGKTKKGYKRMDPLAPDDEPKYATDGSRTPFFGYWFYIAWYNVIVPSLVRTFGPVVNVMDMEDLDALLEATVPM
jgi:hypothetical protein